MRIVLLLSVLANVWLVGLMYQPHKLKYAIQSSICGDYSHVTQRAAFLSCLQHQESRVLKLRSVFYTLNR
jgi:hypothetical protein